MVLGEKFKVRLDEGPIRYADYMRTARDPEESMEVREDCGLKALTGLVEKGKYEVIRTNATDAELPMRVRRASLSALKKAGLDSVFGETGQNRWVRQPRGTRSEKQRSSIHGRSKIKASR